MGNSQALVALPDFLSHEEASTLPYGSTHTLKSGLQANVSPQLRWCNSLPRPSRPHSRQSGRPRPCPGHRRRLHVRMLRTYKPETLNSHIAQLICKASVSNSL